MTLNSDSYNGAKLVSVVIPTIGEPSLARVINALNKGTVIPNEIILAIPEQKIPVVSHLASDNVRILPTKVKGQVQQRIEGFKIAKNTYVLQMDSDIVINENGVEELIRALDELGNKAAVSPVYDNGGSRDESGSGKGIKGVFKKMLNLVIDGRLHIPEGIVTRAGIETWPPFNAQGLYIESQWLPGGCVMHHRENLVLDDFYPFSGKAYGEDVVQSIILRKKGIRLYINKKAIIINEGAFEETYPDLKQLFYFLKKTRKYRRHIISIMDGSRLRLEIWLLYFNIANIFRFYWSKNNN